MISGRLLQAIYLFTYDGGGPDRSELWEGLTDLLADKIKLPAVDDKDMSHPWQICVCRASYSATEQLES